MRVLVSSVLLRALETHLSVSHVLQAKQGTFDGNLFGGDAHVPGSLVTLGVLPTDPNVPCDEDDLVDNKATTAENEARTVIGSGRRLESLWADDESEAPGEEDETLRHLLLGTAADVETRGRPQDESGRCVGTRDPELDLVLSSPSQRYHPPDGPSAYRSRADPLETCRRSQEASGRTQCKALCSCSAICSQQIQRSRCPGVQLEICLC
jgi:hypothetical protein